MSATPPEEMLERARARADQRRRSVYLYQVDSAWYMDESLGSIPGRAHILEIKSHGASGETDNTGGC